MYVVAGGNCGSHHQGVNSMSIRESEIAERRRLARQHKPSRNRRPISEAEAERRRQQSAQQAARDHRDRVLTFRMWCAVNEFSLATGRRIMKRGEGPRVLQLSPRRIGIRESDNAAWQASRAR
jgi:predicted DNA-binding transcriptional regulator AlpA